MVWYFQAGLQDKYVYDERQMDEVKLLKKNKDVLYLMTDKEVKQVESIYKD